MNLGGPTYNAALLSAFLSPKYETLLVSGLKDDSEASSEFILDNYGVKPLYIKEMMREIDLRNDYAAYKKIKEIIKEFKPDIVHTHAAKAGTVGRLAASACGVMSVHTFHGHVFHSYFSPLKTKMFINIERYLATKSTAIIAISEKQKEELAYQFKICKPEKITVIPLGFDLDKFNTDKEIKRINFRKEYFIEDDEIVITIIGRLVPIKNHKLFFDAINNVKNANPTKKIRAFVVGDGELHDELSNYCKTIQLHHCWFNEEQKVVPVTFTSWKKDIDVVCAGSDIIALTSFNEGTPVSLIEAQASGKPIVSTNVGGIENILSPDGGFLSESNNLEALTFNLNTLVENRDILKNTGINGWEFVNKKFTYQRLCEDMDRLYSQILE